MNIFSQKLKIFFLILIIFNTLLSAYWLINGDIHYDVDVSRDFLVMEDIIENNHFTLLGPRSGAIPGIFHGPLWFYINLPSFFLGKGDPLIVGWFWFCLSVFFLLLVFWVTKKLFDTEVAFLSTLLLSANSIINPSIGLKNFYNPYGAVFLTPLFFWLFHRYINSLKAKYLIFSLFTLGFIIQFQMAFGIPILIALTVFLGYLLFIKRKLIHFLSYLILLIPISTFILFDIKHDWLQYKALIRFLSQNSSSGNILNIFQDRIRVLFFDFFDFLSPGKNILTIFQAIFFLVVLIIGIKSNNNPKRKVYILFSIIFFGFWVVSLFYQGGTGNYFWPLLPLAVIVFCSFYRVLKARIFLGVFCLLYLVNVYAGISAIMDFETDVDRRGPHSWAFNLYVAKKIYADAKVDFGYFNFSPDRYAYQQRYAMSYAKKYSPNLNSFSFVKKPLTYLVEVDPPKDRPDLNGTSWRISDVGIDRLPDQIFRFDFIQVEKYFLNNEEIKIEPNAYLLDKAFLR